MGGILREWITENGYSIDQGEYVYNWDDSEYRQEEEEQSFWGNDDDDDW